MSRGFLKVQPALGAAGCESPALLTELLHALLNLVARAGLAAKERPEGDVSLQSRALPVTGPHFNGRPFPNLSVGIHHADRLDDIERGAAHRPGVHAERAADASGYPLQELQACNPWRRASIATAFNLAPAPQRKRVPATSTRPKRGCARQITTPR